MAWMQEQTEAARKALDFAARLMDLALRIMTETAEKAERGETLDARDYLRVRNAQQAAIEDGLRHFEIAAAALKAVVPYARRALKP